MAGVDNAAAAEAAQTAAGYLRRAGTRDYLATAVMNLAAAMIELGDWDAAETELVQAIDSDGLADIEYLTCQRAWLAALRGDAATAGTVLEGLHELRTTEDPQRQASLDLTEAFAAAARGQSQAALRHARAVLALVPVLGLGNPDMAWAWSIAARVADELSDATAIRDLLTLVDSHQPGHVAHMLQAERDLARARLAGHDGDQAAAAAFAAAIAGLRERSTPYHLAHGLLDHARYHLQRGDGQAATQAIDEVRAIGRRLGCRPLLDRADAIDPAQHQIRT